MRSMRSCQASVLSLYSASRVTFGGSLAASRAALSRAAASSSRLSAMLCSSSVRSSSPSAYSARRFDDGFGQQVFARHLFEGAAGQRLGAFARHQAGFVERQLEQVLVQLVVVFHVQLGAAVLDLVQRRLAM
jgi:hypothetical protein